MTQRTVVSRKAHEGHLLRVVRGDDGVGEYFAIEAPTSDIEGFPRSKALADAEATADRMLAETGHRCSASCWREWDRIKPPVKPDSI